MVRLGGCGTPESFCGTCFPYLPRQPGCIKRLGTVMDALIAHLAADASICAGDVVLVDSTPVECARSRETVKRSDLAGWAEYGSLRFALPVLLWAAPAPGGDQHGLPIADDLRHGR